MCIQITRDLDSLLFGLYWLDGQLLIMLPFTIISFPKSTPALDKEVPHDNR